MLATVSVTALHAETIVGSTNTGNLRTATVANGSADDITVNSAGAVTPPSGTAVTIDSNNSVNNAGNIGVNNSDNSVGVGSSAGITGTITNSGTIRVDDAYAASDTNGDGVLDGPFAQGTGRTGILISGTGSFNGTINNSGSVIVEGNNSAGVSIAPTLNGNVISTGAISVLGDNGTALRLGAVNGMVSLGGGTISATGQNSGAVALTGTISGALVIHSTITSTGYSAVTAPTVTTTLGADNLLQGGPAVSVSGNVAGGILIGASLTSTTDTTVDTDADGVADINQGEGTITSYGAAPALQIGSSTNAITIGQWSTSGAALVINGAITGTGVYSGVNATGVQIGGLGQTVTLAGGVLNTGVVTASSLGGNAIGFYAAGGSVISAIANSGSFYGYGGTIAGSSAQAIRIDAGASLPTINNTGTIKSIVAVTGGMATTILDNSGTLASVTNQGVITAANTDGTARAIDVSANTGGFTYTQSLASSTSAAPVLSGAILTGSGNDVIASSSGTIAANATLGAGDDTVALSGTATYTGNIAFGDGNDKFTLADSSSYSGTADFGSGSNSLTIGSGASFSGAIANSASSNLVVSVANGGTLGFTSTGTVSLSSLSLGGTLALTADPANGVATQVAVAGATTITSGAVIKVSLSSLSFNPFTFTLLRSGTLSGSSNLTLTTGSLPYLLTGSFAASDAAGTVNLTIGPRPVGDYGFHASEAGAYGAVYAAIAGNSTLSNLFLGLGDHDSTVLRYRQLLPEYEGATFDMLTNGARQLAPGAGAKPIGSTGNLNLWAQQAWWNGTQHEELTPGYRGSGWGLTAGGDVSLGAFGRVGLSVGYIYTDTHNAVEDGVNANDFQGGAHWLAHWGGLRLAANVAAGYVRFSSVRSLSASSGSELLSNDGHWNGLLVTGNASASYEFNLGLFYLRPSGTLSYARLHEDKYTETGGGAAFDLTVDARTSTETSATGMLAAGLHFGGHGDPEQSAFRIEAEGGRRSVISGNVGDTVANFAGGSAFTLSPEARNGAYLGDLRFAFGSAYFDFSATAGYEKRTDYHGLLGRLALRVAF